MKPYSRMPFLNCFNPRFLPRSLSSSEASGLLRLPTIGLCRINNVRVNKVKDGYRLEDFKNATYGNRLTIGDFFVGGLILGAFTKKYGRVEDEQFRIFFSLQQEQILFKDS